MLQQPKNQRWCEAAACGKEEEGPAAAACGKEEEGPAAAACGKEEEEGPAAAACGKEEEEGPAAAACGKEDPPPAAARTAEGRSWADLFRELDLEEEKKEPLAVRAEPPGQRAPADAITVLILAERPEEKEEKEEGAPPSALFFTNQQASAGGVPRTWAAQGALVVTARRRGGAPLHALRAADRGDAPPLVVVVGPSAPPPPLPPSVKVYRWAPGASAPPAEVNDLLRSRGLRPIEWDPSAPTLVFTDGACSANGAPSAEGAFAVHIPKGPLGGVEAAGRVAPHPYAFVDESEPLLGFAHNAGTAATPTNNRSEYLAWCWALLLLLRGGVEGPVEIVSDCRLFISTLEEWLPARRARGTEGELKNLDLVTIGARLLDLLRAAAGRAGSRVALTHTRSHQPPPPPAADPRTRELWHGNSRADAIARAQLGRPESFRLGTAGSRALHWQLVGRYAAGPR